MIAKHNDKQKLELSAEERTVLGQKVKQLRASGLLPAVLYGRDLKTLSLQVSAKDFEDIFKQAGESTLVYVKVGTATFPTIIHEVTRDPVSGEYLHADFHKVRLDEKVTAMVPIEFVGESPAVKNLGGILVKNLTELEVEALPQDLPHEIQVDLSGLEGIDSHIMLKDVKLKDAVMIGSEDDFIALVQAPRSQEELEAELAEPTTDVEAVEEVKKEGAEAVEGEEGSTEAPAAEKKE